MSEKSLEFEQSLRRLDEIVKRMEEGNVPLAEALKLFEEGTALSAKCNMLLDEAELKVVELVKGKDGIPIEKEFTDGNQL